MAPRIDTDEIYGYLPGRKANRVCCAVFSLCMVLFAFGSAQDSPAGGSRTLGELLAQNDVGDVDQLPSAILRLAIEDGSAGFYSDEGIFFLAGYGAERTPNGQRVDSRLQVLVADRTAGTVKYGALAVEGAGQGSVSRILPTANFIYVSMHLNPSAENSVVLDRGLRLRDRLYGWPLAVLPDDRIVFQNSMTHFAPTHPGRISVYDPVTRVQREIYPPTPYDETRRDFIERVRAAYEARGEDWFRDANHHMDPEAFDSAILGTAVDESSGALAFHVVYSNPINDAGDPLAAHREVVVTCAPIDSIDEITCREDALEDWASELDLEPVVTELLLQRAAANPDLLP